MEFTTANSKYPKASQGADVPLEGEKNVITLSMKMLVGGSADCFGTFQKKKFPDKGCAYQTKNRKNGGKINEKVQKWNVKVLKRLPFQKGTFQAFPAQGASTPKSKQEKRKSCEYLA